MKPSDTMSLRKSGSCTCFRALKIWSSVSAEAFSSLFQKAIASTLSVPSLFFHCSRRHTVIVRPNVGVLVPGPGVVDKNPLILFQESGTPQLFQGRDAGSSFGSDK